MDESKEQREKPETASDRRTTNFVLLAIFVAVVGMGIWLVNGLLEGRKADECMSRGGRDCMRVDVPTR